MLVPKGTEYVTWSWTIIDVFTVYSTNLCYANWDDIIATKEGKGEVHVEQQQKYVVYCSSLLMDYKGGREF